MYEIVYQVHSYEIQNRSLTAQDTIDTNVPSSFEQWNSKGISHCEWKMPKISAYKEGPRQFNISF